jgi:hypothetical protein
MGTEECQILQIIPADNWYAVYWDDKAPYYFALPLACFALVQEPSGDRGVAGMDAGDYVGFADQESNFGEYAHAESIERGLRHG